MDLTALSAMEMAEKIKNREISSKELVKAHFDKIEENEQKINAFITLNMEEALKTAEEIDNKISNKEEVGALGGIPIAVIDNIVTKDIKTTCGSKMLENFIPPYDATVIEKIKKEDGIIIGKTNMDEFGMGLSTKTSYFGPTKNPYDLNKVSGGSAAAVALGEVPLALGTDTGGSVRQPASFTGTVGFKPTYGLISRYGVIPYAPSLDQVGIFSRNVKDNMFLFNILSGYDKKDSTSMNMNEMDYTKNIDIKDFKIGVPKEFFGDNVDSRIKEIVHSSIETMEKIGCKVEKVSLPYSKYISAVYSIISVAEGSASLARFDGLRFGYRSNNYSNIDELYINSRSEGFGEEVKKRIMLGNYVLSSGQYEYYFEKAQKLRTLIIKDFEEVFKEYDLLMTPTTSILPFNLEEKIEESMYLGDILTVSVNLFGGCAISIPCGYVEGLPVGLQFIGDKFKEDILINAAYVYEKNSDIDRVVPDVRGEKDDI